MTEINQSVSASFSFDGKTYSFHSRPHDHLLQVIRSERSFYEEDLLGFLRPLINPGDLVVDVGANIGNHSVFFASITKAKVVAYEPFAEAAEFLQRNIQVNNVADLVEVRRYAVGDRAGNARVDLVESTNLGATRFSEATDGETRVVRLDDETFDDRVTLIKIDVEGMETSVLAGAINLIARDRPIVVLEAADQEHHERARSIIEGLSYSEAGLFCATDTWLYLPSVNREEQDRLLDVTRALLIRNTEAIRDNRRVLRELRDTTIRLGKAPEPSRFVEEDIVALESRIMHRLAIQENDLAVLKRNASDLTQMATSANGSLSERIQFITEKLHLLEASIDEVYQRFQSLVRGPVFRNLNRMQEVLRRLRHGDRKPRGTVDTSRRKNAPPISVAVDSGSRVDETSSPGVNGANPRRQVVLTRNAETERISPQLHATGRSLLESEPLVSVIMTTHNSADTVRDAMSSILDQTYSKLELIVSDDASTDNTCDVVEELMKRDRRVRIIKNNLNRGTYCSKNVAIMEAQGDLITFMDSDDRSTLNRLQLQVDAVRPADVVASLCNYVRQDSNGNLLLNRGLVERSAPISLMIKKEVIADIGYFDSVRTSADVEFQGRIQLAYGKSAVRLVQKPLYIALSRDNSLTNQVGNHVDLAAIPGAQFLSDARAHYQHSFLAWHAALKSEGLIGYMPFPLSSRPFEVHEKLLVQKDTTHTCPVYAFMASFPPRQAKLEQSVQSLLPQVDRLFIYLNEYADVPAFLQHPKISAFPAASMKNLRDNGKLYFLKDIADAYCFLVDDDIIYPDDYVAVMVSKVDSYDRKRIVGVHGVILEQPLTRYFSPGRVVYSFKEALDQDRQVNLLGTGTVAFHSSALQLNLAEITTTGMVDVWLGVIARRANVGMVTVARPRQWLRPIAAEKDELTLYDEFRLDDSQQVEILTKVKDWTLSSGS